MHRDKYSGDENGDSTELDVSMVENPSGFTGAEALALFRLGSAGAKLAKSGYKQIVGDVSLRCVFLDSSSNINNRNISFKLANISENTLYIEYLSINKDENATFKFTKDRSMNVNIQDSPELLPIKLNHHDEVFLAAAFVTPQGKDLFDNPIGKLSIGFCWLSDTKPNRLLEVPFAIRFSGSWTENGARKV